MVQLTVSVLQRRHRLVPWADRDRDTVFIPNGGRCPYVIRRTQGGIAITSETWELVGEVYGHGISSERELDVENKDTERTNFTLV